MNRDGLKFDQMGILGQAKPSGGGFNGTWLLNATTMHDDGSADMLTGSTVAFDWFVVGPGSQDSLKNWRTGEVITNVS
jgi:hypothetical protein